MKKQRFPLKLERLVCAGKIFDSLNTTDFTNTAQQSPKTAHIRATNIHFSIIYDLESHRYDRMMTWLKSTKRVSESDGVREEKRGNIRHILRMDRQILIPLNRPITVFIVVCAVSQFYRD